MTPRPSWRLLAALYPFGAGAAAVNIFFASLIASWIGWRVLTPYESVAWGLLLGLPLTFVFACHIERLKQQANGG
ncbi:NnrT protein [Leisingera sp. JC1]|uniref:NnrT protein n=1 Tax=Leisingera sp. JC1 TaxID=1855282 RepID=UPI0008034D38|nr:NnrT protein [Leisingera sp. JC1]OBY26177.1 NnrT protein [Leisingera sp. JC1]